LSTLTQLSKQTIVQVFPSSIQINPQSFKMKPAQIIVRPAAEEVPEIKDEGNYCERLFSYA